MNIEKAKKLAQEHWSYLERLLLTHHVSSDIINIVKFHYKSAFVHGYKHGQENYEDAKRRTIQMD